MDRPITSVARPVDVHISTASNKRAPLPISPRASLISLQGARCFGNVCASITPSTTKRMTAWLIIQQAFYPPPPVLWCKKLQPCMAMVAPLPPITPHTHTPYHSFCRNRLTAIATQTSLRFDGEKMWAIGEVVCSSLPTRPLA